MTSITHLDAARVGNWRPDVARLLPRDTLTFSGPRWTAVVLVLLNTLSSGRSLVHIFASDSGAQSIASMDVTVAGGANIVDLLGQWGGAQLLEAIIIWVVL